VELADWHNTNITKALIRKLREDRVMALEAIVSAEDKSKACGIVVGITNSINIIENLEEGDLDAT
jgi:hypothetical protein